MMANFTWTPETSSVNLTEKVLPSCNLVDGWWYSKVRDMKFYSLAFILPIGLSLNFLVGCVFIRQRLRRTTPGHYFLAISCSSNVFLLGELLNWMNSFDGDIYYLLTFMETSSIACKWVHFIRNLGRIWTAWLIVAITIERFLTVAFPLKSNRWATPTKAKVVILTELIICIGITGALFVLVESRMYGSRERCVLAQGYSQIYKKWFLTCIVAGELVTPSIIVIIFTALIIWKLRQAQVKRSLSREGQMSKRKRSRDLQPTLALLAIAITFILMRLPYIILYFINTFKDACRIGKWKTYYIYSANLAALVLAVTYYCINFILYYTTGSTFREELAKLSRCQPSRRHGYGSPYSAASRASPVSLRKMNSSPTTETSLLTKKNTMFNTPDLGRNSERKKNCSERSLLNGSP